MQIIREQAELWFPGVLQYKYDTSTFEDRQKHLVRVNTSGHVGVGWHKKAKKWTAKYGKRYLGLFVDKQEAIAARQTAERAGTKMS